MEKYRNADELNYFGSDLNKFANEHCSKQMTVNNIDFLSYKASKGIVRLIESKHTNENMRPSQRKVLEIFASLFKKSGRSPEELHYECYVVRGDYPYITSEVEDLINNKTFMVDQENLIKFLNFEEYAIIPKY